MLLTVEVVSKTGKGFKANGVWYNRGKGATFNDFLGLSKGDVVDTPDDGQWIKSFTVVGKDTIPTPPPATRGGSFSGNLSDERVQSIARQAAVKAVLGSPLVAVMFKDMDRSQAAQEAKKLIEQMTSYSISGKFGEAA